MTIYKIAFRNILRNRRRSSMAVIAIAIGGIALLLFGAFVADIVLGLRTRAVESQGHLAIFRAGYLDYGSGNPGAYAIGGYQQLTSAIRSDPVLAPMLHVITPQVALTGIAGNFELERSKTFFGVGFVPSDSEQMNNWDEYGMRGGRPGFKSQMSDDDATRGIVGSGLARILGLCEALKLAPCPPAPAADPAPSAPQAAARDFSVLAGGDAAPAADDALPRIDLLAATAAGAPNVVTLRIGSASHEPVREIDDSFVGMPLSLAQQLLFGRGEQKVTSLLVQLHHTADLEAARTRLRQLFAERGLQLEVHDYTELNPFYLQVIALFTAIFGFVAVVMGVIVLFTVANTMSMTVVERTNEVGTLRAMGVQRAGVRRQFLVEGLMQGAIGATGGVLLAIVLAALINRSGLHWTPPGETHPVPLQLLIYAFPKLLGVTWTGLAALAGLAAFMPANRASRMEVVDALRHV